MSTIDRDSFIQIIDAYATMSDEARYRPAAPSDGFGNIPVPETELDIEQEQLSYARKWWKDEDSRSYWIGCPSFQHRPAMIYTIEAARLIAGTDSERAKVLLQMAIDEIDAA